MNALSGRRDAGSGGKVAEVLVGAMVWDGGQIEAVALIVSPNKVYPAVLLTKA
eukprot:SAG22_NODE_6315_length_871_cov_63.984456_1_plen_53_part_00